MNPSEMPLKGGPPAEVPLTNPPLLRVIAQIRFPSVMSVGKSEFIAPFQEAIREHYPILRPEERRNVVLSPQGVDTRTSTVWSFNDTESAWRVTLAPDFLALESTRYSSRADFLSRLEVLLVALENHVNPRVVDRIGVRYIDRVVGEPFLKLPSLVLPQVAGVLATPLREFARQAVVENVFDLPEEGALMRTRWGLIPAKGTLDPAAIDPIDEPSWVLDLDAFRVETVSFDVESLVNRARSFAERIYSVFRWAVNDDFLREYGGTL